MAKLNIDKLLELKQLYEQGILTKEEMEAIREKMYSVEQIKEWLTNMAAMDSTVVNALEQGFYVGNKKYMLTQKNN